MGGGRVGGGERSSHMTSGRGEDVFGGPGGRHFWVERETPTACMHGAFLGGGKGGGEKLCLRGGRNGWNVLEEKAQKSSC